MDSSGSLAGETFRVVEVRGVRKYGDYRTEQLVLAWDALRAGGPRLHMYAGEPVSTTAVAGWAQGCGLGLAVCPLRIVKQRLGKYVIVTVRRLLKGRPKPICVGRQATLKVALKLMIDKDFSQLPVVDEQDELVGMLSEESISRTLFHKESRSSQRTATHPQAGKLGPDALAGLQGTFMQDHTERVQKILLDRRWHLWSNPDPATPLWTGDSPVVHWRDLPAGPEFGAGLAKSRTQIVVPLDPHSALWIEAAPRKRPLSPVGGMAAFTPAFINQLVLRSAERELYGPSDCFAVARGDLASNPSWSDGGLRGPTGHDPREVITRAVRGTQGRRPGR